MVSSSPRSRNCGMDCHWNNGRTVVRRISAQKLNENYNWMQDCSSHLFVLIVWNLHLCKFKLFEDSWQTEQWTSLVNLINRWQLNRVQFEIEETDAHDSQLQVVKERDKLREKESKKDFALGTKKRWTWQPSHPSFSGVMFRQLRSGWDWVEKQSVAWCQLCSPFVNDSRQRKKTLGEVVWHQMTKHNIALHWTTNCNTRQRNISLNNSRQHRMAAGNARQQQSVTKPCVNLRCLRQPLVVQCYLVLPTKPNET